MVLLTLAGVMNKDLADNKNIRELVGDV